MRVGAGMGKRKKPAGTPGETVGGEYTEPVKLRAAFKEKLQRVAKDLGKYPGQLIEETMTQYVAQEYLRVLRAELEAAEREARRPKA